MLEAIVDPHHHLLAGGVSRYPWLRDLDDTSARKSMPNFPREYLVDAYLRDFANLPLTKSVHVQAEWNHADPVGETRWLQSQADRHGFPRAVVAYADLAASDVEATLAAHAEFPLVRGIRQIVAWHAAGRRSFVSPHLLLDEAWQRGLSLCARYGFSFDLQCYPEQMDEALEVARRFPDVQLVLDHCGMPGDDVEAWSIAMRTLASADNVAVKLSGFAMADPQWTTESIRQYVRGSVETFGVERCMFASNFPFDGMHARADDLYAAYDKTVSDLSRDERHALFSANAERVYRL
jgi:predicted TIM-barrel fold metal-dependent hydrolase